MKKTKNVIDVIHEKDLKEFLANFDLYEDFINKLIHCKYCDTPVDYENICVIKMSKGQVEFICKDESCYEKSLLSQGDDKNV